MMRKLLIAAASLATLSTAAVAQEPAAPGPVAAPYPNVSRKHIAGVKYEDLQKSDAATVQADAASLQLNVEAVSWGGPDGASVVNSADPMEGGQVAARTLRPGRPTYGDARIATREPTKVEVPNLTAGGDAQPRVSGGTAKVSVLLKACATGTHIKEATITMRSGGPSYKLRDVVVTACDPNGDGETQTCTLRYASLDQ